MRIPFTYSRWVIAVVLVVLTAVIGIAQQAPPAAGAQAPQGAQAGGRRGGAPASMPRLPPLPFPDAPQEFDTLAGRIRAVPMHKGLVNPWSLTFLPNGDMLVTEKAGTLRIVRNGSLDPAPIKGTPEVWARGQGGLLEVLPHPKFSENQLLYLTYSKPCTEGATTALFRARFDGKALLDGRDLFVADNCNTGNPHFGSKLAFGRDGLLYMTIGERGDRQRAQNTASHGGKILRLREDGSVPPDNPFVGRDGYKPEIYTYGHRNPQGLAVHPETGELWSHEHGPQGGDELNLIQAGKNYGWPVVTLGREYNGELITNQWWREGMEQPVTFWSPSIGISGMVFYTGDRFPQWKNSIILGGLSGNHIQRVVFNDRGLLGRETMLGALRLRVRDVRQGPDGLLYIAVDGNPAGILRVEPAQGATTTAER
jgi:glucose/arabinose dehydrogenase